MSLQGAVFSLVSLDIETVQLFIPVYYCTQSQDAVLAQQNRLLVSASPSTLSTNPVRHCWPEEELGTASTWCASLPSPLLCPLPFWGSQGRNSFSCTRGQLRGGRAGQAGDCCDLFLRWRRDWEAVEGTSLWNQLLCQCQGRWAPATGVFGAACSCDFLSHWSATLHSCLFDLCWKLYPSQKGSSKGLGGLPVDER